VGTYIAVLAGTAAMHVMRALQTPLQDATFGSGCKLRMHTFSNQIQADNT